MGKRIMTDIEWDILLKEELVFTSSGKDEAQHKPNGLQKHKLGKGDLSTKSTTKLAVSITTR